MPLVIRPLQQTGLSLEVDAVRLETVRPLNLDQVRALRIQSGNRQPQLGELFEVSGSAAEDNELVWDGDFSRVKRIGAGLVEGRVRVTGNAGMHLGAEMRGGEIIVEGNAGDFAGAEMRGGRIVVRGNAGHQVGGAYRGSRRGMLGGEIFIMGDAGDELGHGMRRGLIAVAGQTGDAPGFGMLAGSLLLFGGAGSRPGAGMKRGTIALFADPAPQLLPTFRYACTYSPGFVRLYLRHLIQSGFPVPAGFPESQFRRYSGDLLELGKGEILIREV